MARPEVLRRAWSPPTPFGVPQGVPPVIEPLTKHYGKDRIVCRLAFLLLFVVMAPGCGGSTTGPSYGSTEGRKIAELVLAVGDSPDAKKLAAFFVQGSGPSKAAELNRFMSNYFELVGNPSVSGATATAKVKLRDHLSGKEGGPVDWSFVKEGDQWKIKSAPLP